MNVAITGICSGLGRALTPKLQLDSSIKQIIGIDMTEYKGNSLKIRFYKKDIRDLEGIEHALQGADVLIHLAFIVIPKKLPKLKEIYDINVNGSKTVFQAAAKNGVKKIIHLSSQSVYGHVKECPRIVTEEAPRLGIKTTNFYYSHTKALVERFLDKFEKSYPNIAIIRIRPPIIGGPHFAQNLGILSMRGKKRTILLTSAKFKGRITLQLVHEEDLTDAMMILIKQNVRGAFNIGGKILLDLQRFLHQEYNTQVILIPRILLNLVILFGKIWLKLSWAQALKYSSLLNTKKIKRELDWEPKYSTEDCLKELTSYI